MSSNPSDIDPYAELDYRADAADLSDDYRLPSAVRRKGRPTKRFGFPVGRRA